MLASIRKTAVGSALKIWVSLLYWARRNTPKDEVSDWIVTSVIIIDVSTKSLRESRIFSEDFGTLVKNYDYSDCNLGENLHLWLVKQT